MIILIYLIFQDSALVNINKLNELMSRYDYQLKIIREYKSLDTVYNKLIVNYDSLNTHYQLVLDQYHILNNVNKFLNITNKKIISDYELIIADKRSIIYGLTGLSAAALISKRIDISLVSGAVMYIGVYYVF